MNEEIVYVGECPVCGGRVIDAKGIYTCENNVREKKGDQWVSTGSCQWICFKQFRGARIGRTDMRKLLEGGTIELECETRDGEKYVATLGIDKSRDGGVYPVRKTLGVCPECGGKVIEARNSWKCENYRPHPDADGNWVNDGTCTFRIPKKIFQRPVDEGTAKMLIEGDAVKMSGLMGRKGKPFDARIVLSREDDWRPVPIFGDDDEEPVFAQAAALAANGVDVAASDETRAAIEMESYAGGFDDEDEMIPFED